MRIRVLPWLIPMGLALGCVAAPSEGPPGLSDGPPDRAAPEDAGTEDPDPGTSAPPDAGTGDSGPADAGSADASPDPSEPLPPVDPRPPIYTDPSTEVSVLPPADDDTAFGALAAEIARARQIERSAFDKEYEVSFAEALSYDPLTAKNLEVIRAAAMFTLDEDELAGLKQNGFAITKSTLPHFNMGYDRIYTSDLPVYVTADSLLQAVHESYGDMLKEIELSALIPTLSSLLDGLAGALAEGKGDLRDARSDLDVYLTVARSLMGGTQKEPLFADNAPIVGRMLTMVRIQGLAEVDLFGVSRIEDGSQFIPRGHYADSVELQRYFQAMMWLGRIDFRLIETLGPGRQVFRRRQVDAMFAFSDLVGSEELVQLNAIDAVLEEFVGESDYMTLDRVPSLLHDLGVSSIAETALLSDQQLAQAIVSGGYGNQRIASHFMSNPNGSGTLPLNRSFAIFGQRYALDSHVFSNVVYDRVQPFGDVYRYMPDPLDVAFAAIGNDQAASLLSNELDTYGYHRELNVMRFTADAHGEDYWNANLYNRWLFTLRALSPAERPLGVPQVMATEAWGRRMLNTQLSSWAQLRHDTILYVKQSYTTQNGCEYPDAYVDPYPAFYAALANYADRGLALTDKIAMVGAPGLIDRMRDHFTIMRGTMQTLGAMAQQELTGVPFDAAQLAFINEAVRDTTPMGCGAVPNYVGWYPRLFFAPSITFNPTIADVHTDPNRTEVLHVGSGAVRPMIVTVETCEGPRAYAGLVSSYHQVIEKDYKRLTDKEWADAYWTRAAPVSWMQDLMP